MKEHRFFTKDINCHLESLTRFLVKKRIELIEKANIENPEDYKSVSTFLANHYNLFQFPNADLKELLFAIRSITKEACEYYEIDYDSQEYMLNAWFNIHNKNYEFKTELLHDHSGGTGIPFFHGYYCVNAEPSTTLYKINENDDKLTEIINKNNRAILSETGRPHQRGNWFEDSDRITIAYDVSPMKNIKGFINEKLWIPLG